MPVPVTEEYIEHHDRSNDGESHDEDGIDSIFDFFNDSAKKKMMEKLKKKDNKTRMKKTRKALKRQK